MEQEELHQKIVAILLEEEIDKQRAIAIAHRIKEVVSPYVVEVALAQQQKMLTFLSSSR